MLYGSSTVKPPRPRNLLIGPKITVPPSTEQPSQYSSAGHVHGSWWNNDHPSRSYPARSSAFRTKLFFLLGKQLWSLVVASYNAVSLSAMKDAQSEISKVLWQFWHTPHHCPVVENIKKRCSALTPSGRQNLASTEQKLKVIGNLSRTGVAISRHVSLFPLSQQCRNQVHDPLLVNQYTSYLSVFSTCVSLSRRR